jgi:hypothetical protein
MSWPGNQGKGFRAPWPSRERETAREQEVDMACEDLGHIDGAMAMCDKGENEGGAGGHSRPETART